MYFGCGSFVTQTMYGIVDHIMAVMTGPKNDEVRWVVSRAAIIRDSWCDVKGLSVNVRVSANNGQHKGVIYHNYMDVVRVLDDPIGVCDGEQNKVESFIPYEPRWDIRCKDVAGGSVTFSDLVGLDRGTVSVTTEGGFTSC